MDTLKTLMKLTLIFFLCILFSLDTSLSQTADEYLDKGNAKFKVGNYKDAIQDYSKAIELEEIPIDAYYARGLTKLQIGDYIGAVQDYNKAIELSPYYDEAYNMRGYAKFMLNDNLGALQDYNKAIESLIRKKATRKKLINQHKNSSDHMAPDMLKMLERLEERDENSLELVYTNRAAVKGKLGDYNGAIKDSNKAIELNPKNAYGYYHRGYIKILLGQKDSGCLDLSKAGELGYSGAYDLIKESCK